MRRILLAIVFAGAITSMVILAIRSSSRARARDFISGKLSLSVSKIVFSGQQRAADCQSPELTAYLSTCFKAPRIFPVGGVVYMALVTLSDGSSVEFEVTVSSDNRWSVGIYDEESPSYGLQLPDPPPATFQDLFQFLNADHKTGQQIF